MIKTISKNLKIIIINAGIVLFIVALNIEHNPPPGWYQQSLPVNDIINDIFFLDSLNGWVVTFGNGSIDTAYLMRTTDGGNNWKIINTSFKYYSKLQFISIDTGFASGAPEAVWKTTNGGFNWSLLQNFGFGFGFDDLDFINYDTGWISSVDFDFGGIWKTTNGGSNWIKQLSPPPTPILAIKAISILNKDTGWAINSSGTLKELYRTTNGGNNWNVQYTFGSQLNDVQFINATKGWISGGRNYYSIDGGFSWSESNLSGSRLDIVTDSVGWIGTNASYRIYKTTSSGIVWGFQISPLSDNISINMVDILQGWAGTTGIVKTRDGGGILTGINSASTLIDSSYKLLQNYPNPFNLGTKINFKLQVSSYVSLKIIDVLGKDVVILVNEKKNPGRYEVEFDGSNLPSGVYFYRLKTDGFEQTKRMVLVK